MDSSSTLRKRPVAAAAATTATAAQQQQQQQQDPAVPTSDLSSQADHAADPAGGVAAVAAKVEADAQTPSSSDPSKPTTRTWGDLTIRLVTGWLMIFFVLSIIWAGHILICLFIVALEAIVFKEIVALGYINARHGKVRWFRTLSWLYFCTVLWFFSGKSVLVHFNNQGWAIMHTPFMRFLLRHHSFVSFTMYCAGYVMFVFTLVPGEYGFQFAHFAKMHVALMLVVIQGHFMILNVKQGIFWFLFPFMLVVCNDTFAYFAGRMFGKTPLTLLSPKKTVEGYIGGAIVTILYGFIVSRYMGQIDHYACPKPEFTDCFIICEVHCDPPPPFILSEYPYPTALQPLTQALHLGTTFYLMPAQIHASILALFASLIAPVGGFFASGVKRAFQVKDFANIIPGHGGLTDRVDCQFLMATFTYVYILNFGLSSAPDVAGIMVLVMQLSFQEQEELFHELYKILLKHIGKEKVTHLLLTLQQQ